MLNSLTIDNVVLIEHLNLQAEKGLCALTGETGAGKSILLDALGLAIGARAESKLVRHGEDAATVTAVFDAEAHVVELLKSFDIAIEDDSLILRRTLGKDGKSKAFINDMPVTAQLLKEIGSKLVEIHGQFETQGLLNPETHLGLLDVYAGLNKEVRSLQALYDAWNDAEAGLLKSNDDIKAAKQQEEYLNYAVQELEKLAPQQGEEEELAQKRKRLINLEKSHEAFEQVAQLMNDEQGILGLFGKLQSVLDKTEMDNLITSAARAKAELDDLSYQVDAAISGDNEGEDNLEQIEERYFALKDCARKHRTTVDNLHEVWEDLSHKLKLITHQEDALHELEAKVEKTKAAFIKSAEALSKKRIAAVAKLEKAVNKELPDLKLDKAKFFVEHIAAGSENDWNASGIDKIRFLVSTNAQTPAGAINKIASGGELARFMLALKVVLAETAGEVSTLIFDEVDSGIGGATAAAVGERLARLSRKYQVLVVTHSAQVAAKANNHWVIAKSEVLGKTLTEVTVLKSLKERENEIARMISGSTITKEAKAAAAKLLEGEANAA